MTTQPNEEPASFIEKAIKNDRKKISLIKDEATEILAEATPNDNPAASAAEAAIEEANIALHHHDIAYEKRSDVIVAAEHLGQAYPHMIKAEEFLRRARQQLHDPIYPKKGDQ